MCKILVFCIFRIFDPVFGASSVSIAQPTALAAFARQNCFGCPESLLHNLADQFFLDLWSHPVNGSLVKQCRFFEIKAIRAIHIRIRTGRFYQN